MKRLGGRVWNQSRIISAIAPLSVALIASLAFAVGTPARTKRPCTPEFDSCYGTDSIGRAKLDGSAAEQSFITPPGYPTGVALDADHIYWVDAGLPSIGRASLDGSGVEESFISLGSGINPNPTGLAVDAAHIYWSDESGGWIGRANLDGTSVQEHFIASDAPKALAIDTGHIYWTAGRLTHAIARANLDGSGVEQSFIDIPFDSWGIAVDDEHIYWTNYFQRAIGRANLDGSGVDQSFISGLTEWLGGLAVDADHIYWTTVKFPGAIGRASLDGSAVDQSFISSGSWVHDVETDAGHVYWVNHSERSLCMHCGPEPPDSTAPDTNFTEHLIRRSSVTFRFWSPDQDATFECSIDKKSWKPCASPKTVRRLRTGRHRFRVRATDSSGNTDKTPAVDRFKVLH